MKRYLTILAMLSLLAGCNENKTPEVVGPDKPSGSVELSQTAVTLGPAGGEAQVTVTSSSTWRVAGVADWVSVSPVKGNSGDKLTITVAPNAGDTPLTAVFKIFSDSAVEDLTVTSRPPYLLDLLSDKEVTVGPDATEVVVTFRSNLGALDVDFSDAGWARVTGQTDVLGQKAVKLSILRSSAFVARENMVTFSAEGVEEPVAVKLIQSQRDTAFVVSGDEHVKRIIKGIEAMDLTLTVKSNFELRYDLPSWLAETSSSRSEVDEKTGLMTTTIGLHANACSDSRAENLHFYKQATGGTNGAVYIKQQKPNPQYVQIEDSALSRILENNGWILRDPDDGKCELLEGGLTGASLSINNAEVKKISGLEVFPNLSSLTIGTNTRNVNTIDVGSSKVAAITLGTNHYLYSESLAIAGENITAITLKCTSYYIYYGYDQLKTLDVSACPALASLNCVRQYSGRESPLHTIYMTAAQQESVTVEKNPSTEIVVK